MKAIVIGTGAGGLTAAAALAQQGFEVTALEQAKQLGGYLNPFARKHFHFDPGVHYVGQCGRGQMVNKVLRAVGVDSEALFCEMDRDGFDVIRFPGFEVRMCAGLDRYRDRLAELFPRSVRELDRFFDLMRAVDRVQGAVLRAVSGRPRLKDLRVLPGSPSFLRAAGATFGGLLEAYVSDARLRSVLAAQCGDYGVAPSDAPAALGIGVLLHYAEGAYFPRGGSGTLRDALVERAQSKGAVFRRRARVEKIVVEGGRARAVELTSGERFEADVVVSAIDPSLTLGSMLDGAKLPSRYDRKLERYQPSVGSLCVFLGMKRDLREHGLGAFNVWDYPSWDLDAIYRPMLEGRFPDGGPVFLSPNSLKDDSGSLAPEGCSTLEVVTLAPFAPFAKWAGMKAFKRGAEYEALKARVADELLEAVETRWPGVIGDVVVKDVATPVTNTHYVNAVGGGAYGPAALKGNHGAFKPWTPVKGLFLAGAGVFGCGVAPCLASGVVAAKVAKASLRRRLALPGRRPAPLAGGAA